MEAKNFRIGNLVNYAGYFSRIIQISEDKMSLLDIKDCGVCNDVKFEEIKPIGLTEDWVKKLGFNDSDYREGYTGIDSTSTNGMTTDFVITKPKFMGEWQTYYAFDLPSHRFSTINYVHELQNLFNIITGHELEYKEI